jgi:hypothetical protein
MKMNILEEIQKKCNGIEYSRDIPEEAKLLAKENNCVVIVGGSDDLMYCYGADSYLTDYVEHGEGWDGCDLANEASDDELRKEAKQLGLKIFWCGKIHSTGEEIEGYNTDKNGAFSYQVKEGIQHLNFKVMEDETDVYCTGIVIQLPENFESALV